VKPEGIDGGGIWCKEKYFKIFTFYNLKVVGGEEKITSSVWHNKPYLICLWPTTRILLCGFVM
jgi:hypothetical protein